MGKKWKRTWLRRKLEAEKATAPEPVKKVAPAPKPEPVPEPVVEVFILALLNNFAMM